MSFTGFGGSGFNPSNNPAGYSNTMSFFQGLTGHYDIPADSTKVFDVTNMYGTGSGWSGGSFSRANALGQIIKQISSALEGRNGLLKELRMSRENELVQTLLSNLVNDAFSSIADDTFLSVEYNNKLDRKSSIDDRIQAEIDKFVKKHDLAGLARDIVPDWMLEGEYFLRTKVVKGQGIVEIIDDCDTEEYIGLYKGRELSSFLRNNVKTSKFELLDRHELSHFILDGSKIKVKVELPEDIENLPKSIRMGKSVIYPVLTSVRKLNVLETTSLAMELKRVLAPILVSIDIPADTDNQYITDIIDKYENYLNDINMEATYSDNYTVADSLQSASRIKVIPKHADSKGAIEQIRFDYDNSDLNNRINDIRKSIAMAMGVPSFYLSYGDQLLGKTDMLKVYSAYSRKLVGIQTSFGEGIKNLVYKHLIHTGEHFPIKNNIEVKFKSVTNLDILDDIDVMVATMTALRDCFNLIEEASASDQFKVTVDDEKLIEIFNMFTASFPKLQGVLKLYNDGKGKEFNIPANTREQPATPTTPTSRKPAGGTQISGSNLSTPSTPAPPPTPNAAPKTQPVTQTPPPETPKGGELNIGDVF